VIAEYPVAYVILSLSFFLLIIPLAIQYAIGKKNIAIKEENEEDRIKPFIYKVGDIVCASSANEKGAGIIVEAGRDRFTLSNVYRVLWFESNRMSTWLEFQIKIVPAMKEIKVGSKCYKVEECGVLWRVYSACMRMRKHYKDSRVSARDI